MKFTDYSNNILINAMCVHPEHGSEFGFAWNWIIELSKRDLKITVITGIHADSKEKIESYIESNGIKNLNFHFIPFKKFRLALIPQFSSYLTFWNWHFRAFLKARSIYKSEQIDVIHQLNTIGYRLPGFQFLLKKPIVWGPIGGGEQVKRELINHIPSFSDRIKKHLYNLVNWFQWNLGIYINYCFSRADAIICSTSAIQRKTKQKLGASSDHVFYIPETGCINVESPKYEKEESTFIVSYASLLHHGKNITLILDSLVKLKDKPFRFIMCGDGPLKNYLQNYAIERGLDNIEWRGWIGKEETKEVIADSDIFIMPTIREANSSVIFEALSAGTPVISLNICGMKDIIVHEYNGYKIHINKSKEKMVEEITTILVSLFHDSVLLNKLSNGAVNSAKKHTYSKRIDELLPIYKKAIQNYNGSN